MGKVIFNDEVNLNVEIAATPDKKCLGLMHRKELPEDQGMVFLYGGNEDVGIWMKNTYLPLDIIFVDNNNIVNKIAHGEPLCEDIIKSSYIPIKYVVETNKGFCRKHDIKEGDKAKFQLLEKEDCQELKDIANTLEELGLLLEAFQIDNLIKYADYIDDVSQYGEDPIAGDPWRHHMGKAHSSFIQGEKETRARHANDVRNQLAQELEAAESDKLIQDFIQVSGGLIGMAQSGGGIGALQTLGAFYDQARQKNIIIDLISKRFNDFVAYIGLLTFINGLENGVNLLDRINGEIGNLNDGSQGQWLKTYKEFESNALESGRQEREVEKAKESRKKRGLLTEPKVKDYRQEKREEMESDILFNTDRWFEDDEEAKGKSDEEKKKLIEKRYDEYLKDEYVDDFVKEMNDIIKNPYENISVRARQNLAIWLQLGDSPFSYTMDDLVKALEAFEKEVGTQPINEDNLRRMKKLELSEEEKKYTGGDAPSSRARKTDLLATKKIEQIISEVKEYIDNKLQELINDRDGVKSGFSTINLAVRIAPRSTREIMEMLVAFAQLKQYASTVLDIDVSKETSDSMLREYAKIKGLRDYDVNDKKIITSKFLQDAGNWRKRKSEEWKKDIQKKEKQKIVNIRYWQKIEDSNEWKNIVTGDKIDTEDLMEMLVQYKSVNPGEFEKLPRYLKELLPIKPAVEPVIKKKIKRDEKKSQVIFNLIKIANELDYCRLHTEADRVDGLIKILRRKQ